MIEKNTRACPFCGEEILATAKKCKHCGEFLKTEEEIDEEKNLKPLVYGKCMPVKILTVCLWGFLSFAFIFTGFSANSTNTKQVQQNPEGTGEVVTEIQTNQQESSGGGIMVFIGLLLLIPIWQLYAKKLIIDKDHVTIKSGILFKKSEDIKYKKINNIGKSSFLGFGGIKIYTGNDKPVVFNNLQDYEIVINKINSKIDKN